MRYDTIEFVEECELADFPAWCGGREWLNDLCVHEDAYDYIVDMLTDTDFWSTKPTKTDINDFLWFDMMDILEEAGYYDSEEDIWFNSDGEKED